MYISKFMRYVRYSTCITTFLSDDQYDECALELDQCEQECIDTATGHVCSCHNGYHLDYDAYSCLPYCKEMFSSENGSFQTPGWPEYYPSKNFRCQWLIDVENDSYAIQLITDDSAYGIRGGDPCRTDYLAFYDGPTSAAPSLGRHCSLNPPPPKVSTSHQAMVVFQASSRAHPPNRVGARVSYEAIRLGMSA